MPVSVLDERLWEFRESRSGPCITLSPGPSWERSVHVHSSEQCVLCSDGDGGDGRFETVTGILSSV